MTERITPLLDMGFGAALNTSDPRPLVAISFLPAVSGCRGETGGFLSICKKDCGPIEAKLCRAGGLKAEINRGYTHIMCVPLSFVLEWREANTIIHLLPLVCKSEYIWLRRAVHSVKETALHYGQEALPAANVQPRKWPMASSVGTKGNPAA